MKPAILEKPNNRGFTLFELLISLAITGIILGSVYVIYASQQKSYSLQEEIAAMQQNIRAAMYIMEKEIRMAGFDPTDSGNFGITDIRKRNINYMVDPNGNSALEFTLDDNLNGIDDATDEDGILASDGSETISFSLYDPEGDGRLELARRVSGVRNAIAENIYALGFAFAFDADGDGELDTKNDQIIWAIASNNDNELNLSLDTNLDGVIDEKDDTDVNGLIDDFLLKDFFPPIPPVAPADIRAVRIWLLARTAKEDKKILNKGPYVVGDRVIKPVGDDRNYRYELLSTVIKCRNMGN